MVSGDTGEAILKNVAIANKLKKKLEQMFFFSFQIATSKLTRYHAMANWLSQNTGKKEYWHAAMQNVKASAQNT